MREPGKGEFEDLKMKYLKIQANRKWEYRI